MLRACHIAALPMALFALLRGGSGIGLAVADEEPAEPAPPALEEPEPPPAPLELPAAPALRPTAAPTPVRGRALEVVAWSSVAVTVALTAAGTALGVLALRRADDLSRLSAASGSGPPPFYDGALASQWSELSTQGQSYNRAAISSFLVSGATAVASGILFWNLARSREPKVALLPIVTTQGGQLVLGGRM